MPIGTAASGAYGTALTGYVSYRPIERLYLEAVFGAGDVVLDSTRRAGNGADGFGTRRADQTFFSVSAVLTRVA